jgi:hypothetical protein
MLFSFTKSTHQFIVDFVLDDVILQGCCESTHNFAHEEGRGMDMVTLNNMAAGFGGGIKKDDLAVESKRRITSTDIFNLP